MPLSNVFINNIEVAVPETEVQGVFLKEGADIFFEDERKKKLLGKLVKRSQIERRYSVLRKEELKVEFGQELFYKKEELPATKKRMQVYQERALPLAMKAVNQLAAREDLNQVTHVLVTSCTGFYAPGLDIEIIRELGLPTSTERLIIGFMGCYAGFNALKQAKNIVRGDENAKVLVVNLELCTLHLQKSDDMEQIMAFSIFADGAAASLVSSESRGLELEEFHSSMAFENWDDITWQIGDQGFDMHLSMNLPKLLPSMLKQNQMNEKDFDFWAIHPGGRAILDSVKTALDIPEEKLSASRSVLRDYGNMSSATIMFVLHSILRDTSASGKGFAMGFGPGLTLESFRFKKAPM